MPLSFKTGFNLLTTDAFKFHTTALETPYQDGVVNNLFCIIGDFDWDGVVENPSVDSRRLMLQYRLSLRILRLQHEQERHDKTDAQVLKELGHTDTSNDVAMHGVWW